MSSHREAPQMSMDPVADSTDLYAFRSPDDPDTITIIANYVPLQEPAGGPNFYQFGDDVLYEIHVDNDGDGDPDITYQFRFTTTIANTGTFLYNTGPITSLSSPNWVRKQSYTVSRITEGTPAVTLGSNLSSPPCNIGPRSTPDYDDLAKMAVHSLPGGITVFAGQRREGFFVDLGSIFDLGTLRPFQNLHLIPSKAAGGVDSTAELNVHSIAIKVPIKSLVSGWTDGMAVTDPRAAIGVWTSASRQSSTVRHTDVADVNSGVFTQVSRLGNPLINELLIQLVKKDYWNRQKPAGDVQFVQRYLHPELAALLPILYPDGAKHDVFPHLQAYSKPRNDLVAILLTGIPASVLPKAPTFTGTTLADELRLNVAVKPTNDDPSQFGVLGGDLAGFPNGRRVFDDVVAIELRAVAGLTIPLVDPTFTPDAAASLLTDGTRAASHRYQKHFPYLGTPLGGYEAETGSAE